MPQRNDFCSKCFPTESSAVRKLRSMKLLQRLRANDYFSESERVGLHALLLEGEAETVRYQGAIDKLKEMINVLSRRKFQVAQDLQRAKSLIAPVRKFPPEILGKIFAQCDNLEYRIPNSSPSESEFSSRFTVASHWRSSGFIVAAVSSHWRSVALATPVLWNRVCIDWNVFREDEARVAAEAERLLAYPLGLPLHIKIFDNNNEEVLYQRGLWKRARMVVNPAFSLLCEKAHQWQSLILLETYEPDIITALEQMRMRLTNLTVFHCGPDYSFCIRDSTRLQQMRVLWVDDVWSVLQDLSATNLSFLHVDIAPTAQEYHPSPLVLAGLHSLAIKTTGTHKGSKDPMESLFDALTLPSLHSLSIITEYKPFGSSVYDSDSDSDSFGWQVALSQNRWETKQLPNLLERSAVKLDTLNLCGTWMSEFWLERLLKSQPSLRTLVFEEPKVKGGHYNVKYKLPILTDSFFQHIDARQSGILPRLESLSLAAETLSFDLQLFVQVIEFRWSSSHAPHESKCFDAVGLKSVALKIQKGKIAPDVVASLMSLKRRGLVLSVIDEDGDIASRERSEGGT